MNRRTNKNKWSSVLRSLDLITATLLLNGQVTITGVFLQTGGAFSLSLSGPITGGFQNVSGYTSDFRKFLKHKNKKG
ncbi:hypothetical protein SAMN05661091_4506 [Paenibacillus uliginis N3/975]|uniref:Uncharacterized protein n=1 Tax=Paenibacillus uliginis N3/975 TaxID=1313296 RepID=A0A1X7HNF3_9BACL|nr:hypothetical protein SAMN05661091_4506 [Paenibacillus uliginis N3/975]